MTARLGRLIADRPTPALSDVALAAILAVYGLGHAWLGWIPGEGRRGGPQLLNTAVMLLATVPLAWRRRAPLATLAVILATFSLSLSLTRAMGSFYAGLLPVVIGTYSVARNGSLRQILAGIGLTLAAWTLLVATTSQFRTAEEIVFDSILLSSALLIGWTIRTGEKRARDLGRRAERLEREREAQARAAVLDERARIARELHDIVAHGMSLMVVQAGAARSLLEGATTDSRVHRHLRSLETSGRQSLSEMRRLLRVLRDDDELALEPLPGMEQLHVLVAAAREANIDVTVQIEGQPDPLPPGIDLAAYRIVQEALTNTIKHAGPASAQVTIRYRSDALELEIVDDGRSARNGNRHGAGHGLIGMRERAALYGGELQAAARENGGYAVRVRLPIVEET
jgi:signal transduction histidine kinase